MRPHLTLSPETPREAAVRWVAREIGGTLSPEDQAALRAWLEADPRHVELYAQVRDAALAVDRHAASAPLMDLRRDALAALKASPRPRSRIYGLAAGLVCALAVGSVWMGLQPNTRPSVSRLESLSHAVAPALTADAAIHATRVGERTSVTLPDGTVATLNTDTVLKVGYRRGERAVRLVRGQALFEVAKDASRPFRVYAADRSITAVGTIFDVRLDGGRVKVALVEGVVAVARDAGPRDAPVQRVTMTAGEVLEALPASTMTVHASDAAHAVEWRRGVASFQAAPLVEAVAEINRYTQTPISVDPAVADLRVTGVFRTGDPLRFARSVSEVLPVVVDASDAEGLTLRRPDQKTSLGG